MFDFQSTELFMLEDTSEDFSDTWSFLDRRFDDELNIAAFLMGSRESRKVIMGVFNTIQNMMGVPRK